MTTPEDPLTQALETLNLRELTGDSDLTAEEAANLIRDGIRERSLWDAEELIWLPTLAGAIDLCKARGWEYDPSDHQMLRKVVSRLTNDQKVLDEYLTWCDLVDPRNSHYFHKGPLGEDQFEFMLMYEGKLLTLFSEHLPDELSDDHPHGGQQ